MWRERRHDDGTRHSGCFASLTRRKPRDTRLRASNALEMKPAAAAGKAPTVSGWKALFSQLTFFLLLAPLSLSSPVVCGGSLVGGVDSSRAAF